MPHASVVGSRARPGHVLPPGSRPHPGGRSSSFTRNPLPRSSDSPDAAGRPRRPPVPGGWASGAARSPGRPVPAGAARRRAPRTAPPVARPSTGTRLFDRPPPPARRSRSPRPPSPPTSRPCLFSLGAWPRHLRWAADPPLTGTSGPPRRRGLCPVRPLRAGVMGPRVPSLGRVTGRRPPGARPGPGGRPLPAAPGRGEPLDPSPADPLCSSQDASRPLAECGKTRCG